MKFKFRPSILLSPTVRFLFRQLKGNRLQAVLNATSGLLLVGLDLAFVWATKRAVDIATLPSPTHNAATDLHPALALIAFIMVLRIAVSLGSRWIRAILGVKAQNHMRRELFERLLCCQWVSLKRHHTAALTNRLERDVADVVSFMTETVPAVFTTVAQFIGAFCLLFFMDHTLAIIIILLIPFFALSAKAYARPMRRLSHRARTHDSAVWAVIQETLSRILVVKSIAHTAPFLGPLKEQQQAWHQCILKRTKYSTWSSGLMNFGFAMGYFLTFAWGACRLADGSITYGAMLAFVQLVGQIQSPVRSLSQFVPAFITAFTAADRLTELERIPLDDTAPHHAPQPAAEEKAPGIRFEKVTFSYTKVSRKIFEGFTYDLPPQSVTAVMGETGTGKTTLVRLMLGLITPTEGKVEFYGTDTNSVPAYVPQGNSLFSGTVKSNLLMACPQATDEELKKALWCAAADTFVMKRPLGLNTACGEAGDGFSEGQAQRIAIARCLLMPSSVKIFDEATSSLDPETESIVLERIAQTYRHHTLVFITHRPEVLKYATQVLRL